MGEDRKKDGVSVNACIGQDLFSALEELCAVTGQSKTVAVERAIRAHCTVTAGSGRRDEGGQG